MIFGDPTGSTNGTKAAQAAMLDRIGISSNRRIDGVFEPRSHAAVIGGEIVVAQRTLLADAKKHVHVLGRSTLNAGDAVAVETELEHIGRLLGASELRVERFVTPRAEIRCTR